MRSPDHARAIGLARRALLLGLLLHVGFGVLRLPHATWGRRLSEIRAMRELGPARYHFRHMDAGNADAVEWLAQHTAPDAIVLFRGDYKGALEFAPALLYPRLLYDEREVAPDATTVLERPLARRAGAVVVLTSGGAGLRLVER